MKHTASSADAHVSAAASAVGYTAAEIKAGPFFSRKEHRTNPPGAFDKARRFFAQERTEAVEACRSPSRNWPYSEMNAARTAAHCAEVYAAEALIAVKRVAKLRAVLDDRIGEHITAHELVEIEREAAQILKPVKRRAKREET
jgi:hypothetical protein